MCTSLLFFLSFHFFFCFLLRTYFLSLFHSFFTTFSQFLSLLLLFFCLAYPASEFKGVCALPRFSATYLQNIDTFQEWVFYKTRIVSKMWVEFTRHFKKINPSVFLLCFYYYFSFRVFLSHTGFNAEAPLTPHFFRSSWPEAISIRDSSGNIVPNVRDG